MKAEHRHELKTNELAQWLSNFPQWAKDNMRMLIYIGVVIVVVVGMYGWRFYNRNIVQLNERLRFSQLLGELNRNEIKAINGMDKEGVDYSYLLIETANKFRNFTRNTKNNNMAALAYIKQAEALRAELHYRSEPVQQQYVKGQIAKAKKAYESAVEKAKQNPSLLAMANYGLGLCAEEIGDFAKAKEIYQQVAEDKKFDGTIASASAQHRLSVMDDYKNKVVFRKVAVAPQVPQSPVLAPPGAADLKIDDVPVTLPAKGETDTQ